MNYREEVFEEDVEIEVDLTFADEKHSPNEHNPTDQVTEKNQQTSDNGNLQEALTENKDTLAAPYDGLAVSLEVYWAEFYGQTEHTYEWNNGILEAKPMAKFIQVKSYIWFLALLRDYFFGNPIAEMTLLETPFEFTIPGQTKVRIPDLAVVLNSNPVPLELHERTYSGIFDICIESVSDSDINEVERDTIDKWEEYAQGGVPEYYILDERHPSQRLCETAFYRLDPNGIYQRIQPSDGVIRSTVLPGFQFRIDDLYTCPTALDMLDDPVYKGFTSPLVRAERERAERAEKELRIQRKRVKQVSERAEQEQLHAEQASERAEQEQLRAEGLQVAVEQERLRAEQASERAEQEQLRAEGLQVAVEQERLRAEQASERAEQEQLRAEGLQVAAEQERQRAEQLKSYLEAQGIPLPDDWLK